MSNQRQNPSTHVIFDFGGTLSDVIPVLKEFFSEFSTSIGKIISDQFLDNIENTTSMADLQGQFSDAHQLDSNQKNKFKNEFQTILFKKLSEGVDMCGGAQKLINHLFENNIPMAIATNIKTAEMEFFTQITKGFSLDKISHVVCGGDDPEVKLNKPEPDVYLVCADRFKYKPKSMKNCVIFEDSLRGITGAVASGMKTVLINDMKSSDYSDISDKITEIVDSLNNFKPESVGLPPYKTE